MKKFLYPILAISFIISFSELYSQEDAEPINTDRPDQSDGAYILNKGNLQIEEGLFFDKESSLNNFMLRAGITNSTELRLLIDAGTVGSEFVVLPIGFSFKQSIFKQKKYIPAITLSGYFRHDKLASSNIRTDNYSYFLNFVFQYDIGERWSTGFNAGTTDYLNNLIFTSSTSYSASEKITFFCEYFSKFEKGRNPQHNFDGGILFLVNKKMQLDIAYATSLLRDDAYQYVTIGFSYRFK
ncbi:MAG: transporter [Bacteroidota bacterium]|jgi:hypothetical protein